ncbi:MAG: MFS transporter [Thermodesulfobacteriota bacterium]|nr:MAG: MFS transporter [Candidatus Dadabacteria bacterium]
MKFSKNIILITLSAFFFFYAYHAFLILPIRVISLGGTEFDIGLVMSMAGISTLLVTPISGLLGDIYKKKYLLTSGALLLALINFLFIYFDSIYYSYLILRFFQGCAFSLFFVSAGTLIAENSLEENQTQALGFFGIFAIVNHALAPTISIEIINFFSYDYFFISSSIASIIAFFIALSINVKNSMVDERKNGQNFTQLLKNKKLKIVCFIMFLVGGSFLTCLNFAAVFTKSINVLPITIFFLSYTVIALIMRIFFGWLPDKYGQVTFCKPALILYGLSIGILGLSINYISVMSAGILFGISHALVYPSIYTLALRFTDISNKSKAFSTCSVSFTFGGMIFSIIYGLIAETYSFKVMFLSCSIIVTLGFYCLIKLLEKEILNEYR